MPPVAIVVIAILGAFVLITGGVFLFGGPIGEALARRIEGRAPAALTPEAVEARLDEAAALRHQVAELEERLEFAERVLTQSREPAKLPDPGTER